MKNNCRGPAYNLDEVKRLVERGSYLVTKRVENYLTNHGMSMRWAVEGVVGAMDENDYCKSDELRAKPGTIADIYRHVWFDDQEWYVKLFIDLDGDVTVEIWSLKEDGYGF